MKLHTPPSATASRPDSTPETGRLGVVVIGRNEGRRLRRCLETAVRYAQRIVYVDSASTDDSPAVARALGVDLVELDPAEPMSAARARNAGFEHLMAIAPEVEAVQFVDGDCELDPDWLDRGMAELESDENLAVVAGRCRERFPDRNVYHRLCDIEWDVPAGESEDCGGNALMRAAAFREAGGFNPEVVAGEEPELCVRLRQRGWRLVRVDAEMVLHDAAMNRFSQWWRRSVRAGQAYAQGAALHGRSPELCGVRNCRSNWFWGLVLPLVVAALAWPTHGWSLLLLGGYLVLAWRVYRHSRRRSLGAGHSLLYAAHIVLGKFPQSLGQAKFFLARLVGSKPRLIEHKDLAP